MEIDIQVKLSELADTFGDDDCDYVTCLEAITEIENLRARVANLEERVSNMGWALDGGDRMGGAFNDWEKHRRGDEWS